MRSKEVIGALCLSLLFGVAGACGEAAPAHLAPSATQLPSSAPQASASVALTVLSGASSAEFAMNAPAEKLRGRLPKVSGKLTIDPADLLLTTGTIAVDLSALELFQSASGEGEVFAAESKNAKQNADAREWLEIAASAPQAIREKNARAEFRITKVLESSPRSVAEGEVTAEVTASGELLLHGRVATKTVRLRVTLRVVGGAVQSAVVTTSQPLVIGLEEHDVRPRDTFGSLAQKTLADLGQTVAREARVSLDLTLLAPGADVPKRPSAPPPPGASADAATDTRRPEPSAAPGASTQRSALPSAPTAGVPNTP